MNLIRKTAGARRGTLRPKENAIATEAVDEIIKTHQFRREDL
jgi:hypothetical protein